jgi:glutaredoxin
VRLIVEIGRLCLLSIVHRQGLGIGSTTCADCNRSKKVLETSGVHYDFIDLAVVTEAVEVAEKLAGRKSTPVLSFPDGSVQVEPTDAELSAKLAELGLTK